MNAARAKNKPVLRSGLMPHGTLTATKPSLDDEFGKSHPGLSGPEA